MLKDDSDAPLLVMVMIIISFAHSFCAISTRHSWIWLVAVIITYASLSVHSDLSPDTTDAAVSSCIALGIFSILVWFARYYQERLEILKS